MAKRKSQGVGIRMTRQYISGAKESIVRIRITPEEWGRLNGIVARGLVDGLGVNGQGEIELSLVNYDRNVPVSPGYLGLRRTGATKGANRNTPLLGLQEFGDETGDETVQ